MSKILLILWLIHKKKQKKVHLYLLKYDKQLYQIIKNINHFNTKDFMEQFEALKKLVLESEEDFNKFYDKKNQAAGTRVRKAMQDLKTLAQDIRKEVQDIKNAEEAK